MNKTRNINFIAALGLAGLLGSNGQALSNPESTAAVRPPASEVATATPDYRPANFDKFVDVTSYASINEAVEQAEYLYFPTKPGKQKTVYVINNPIVVDRERPLFLRGTSLRVELVPEHFDQPLFIFRNAPYVGIEGLEINYRQAPGIIDAEAVRFENTKPLVVDIQMFLIRDASLVIKGPGRYIMRRYGNIMSGLLTAGIMIDHPQAEVVLISAGGNNREVEPQLQTEDMYWVWCKQGHLEAYGTFPAGFTRGRADIRIDNPSFKGAHILAFNRTEGTKRNRAADSQGMSRLLYVPPSDKKVDIALKANHLVSDDPQMRMVDYNAAGTLWLIGNHVNIGGKGMREFRGDDRRNYLVEGHAPNATIVAIANSIWNDDVLTKIVANRKIAIANVGDQMLNRFDPEKVGEVIAEKWMFLPELNADAEIPPVPRSVVPALDLPSIGEVANPLLGLESVKTFGAKGDGVTDDTDALQKAFDSNAANRLFFPPGIYVTTRPLKLSIWDKLGAGGWIAGAGSDKSIIRNIKGGSVVNASGLYWMEIHGLSFETVDQTDIAFSLDRHPGHTSGNLFYDCRFVGGSIAMGIAVIRGPNCEHIFFDRCSFEDADIGWANGNMNALMNMVQRATFKNNRINIAMRRRDAPQHAWPNVGVLSAEFIGTREMDFEFSLHKARYFLDIKSDSAKIAGSFTSTKYYDIQIFENCQWPNTRDVLYESKTSGGPIFLYSKTGAGDLRIQPPGNNKGFAINLWSEIPGWQHSSEQTNPQQVRFFEVMDEPQATGKEGPTWIKHAGKAKGKGQAVRLFILSGQSNMVGLTGETSFLPHIEAAFGGDELIFVKHSKGGVPIDRWYPKPREGVKFGPNAPGAVYGHLMEMVRREVGDRKLDSVSLVWMQGEANGKDGRSRTYKSNLEGLIQQFRQDLGREDMTIVIGRLNTNKIGTPDWDAVRVIQQQVADADERAAWVDLDDLGNALHYSSEGYEKMGERFAQEAIKLLQ